MDPPNYLAELFVVVPVMCTYACSFVGLWAWHDCLAMGFTKVCFYNTISELLDSLTLSTSQNSTQQSLFLVTFPPKFGVFSLVLIIWIVLFIVFIQKKKKRREEEENQAADLGGSEDIQVSRE